MSSRGDTGVDVRDAYGPRAATTTIAGATFEACELFFSRLLLGGVDWGDITRALSGLAKASTFEDWVDWHRRWTALAHGYERRAEEARAAAFHESERQWLLKAAACHHFAEFMFVDAPADKQASRARVTELFERARVRLRERVLPVQIPYRELRLPGYLLTGHDGAPRPCVVVVNGLDSAKEVELYAFARELVARGMCALLFDGPGQGVLAGRVPMVVEFERVVGAALDALERRPEVDAERIGVFGVSFGGYLAARAAARDDRLRACVNLSGGFDHDGYAAINVMVRKGFRYVFGVDDDAAMERLCRTSLNLRDVPPLRQPLLAIHGEQDSIIPLASCRRMLDWAVGETELICYPRERHVATNRFGDFIPRFADWLARRLGAA